MPHLEKSQCNCPTRPLSRSHSSLSTFQKHQWKATLPGPVLFQDTALPSARLQEPWGQSGSTVETPPSAL